MDQILMVLSPEELANTLSTGENSTLQIPRLARGGKKDTQNKEMRRGRTT
jgi:hypothetical protein